MQGLSYVTYLDSCHSTYERYMIVEVEPNENCDSSVFARFKEAGPARRVVQVRMSDRSPAGEWCWVTGWSDQVRELLADIQAHPLKYLKISVF